jgi:hypothetical protein
MSMLKQTAQTLNPARVADAAIAASRQVWLAGLGAAMVTRDWARNDAGHVFRSLVKEGSTVETRVIRAFGHRMNSSIAVATTALNKARDTALAGVNELVDTAAAALPKLKATVAAQRAAAKPKKAPSRKSARKTRRAKRSSRKA